MMVCDKCEVRVCHNFCLKPPIDFIPANEFYCNTCVAQHGLKNKFKRPAPLALPPNMPPVKFFKEVELIPAVESDEEAEVLKLLALKKKNKKRGRARGKGKDPREGVSEFIKQ